MEFSNMTLFSFPDNKQMSFFVEFSLCLFSLVTRTFSHHAKAHVRLIGHSLIAHRCDCECEWFSVSMYQTCDCPGCTPPFAP